jgi:large subunit ribosomal protein L4
VHGPQPRSYAWSFPRKMRRNAIKCALSEMIREGNLVVVDKFDLATHRTAELEKSLSAGLGLEKKTLLLSLEEDKNLSLAARNNPRLNVNRALGVNIVELLDSDKVVISEEALLKLGEVLS